MVKTRFRVQDIQSLQPAIDQRNLDKVYVLEGKNFYFDAKGPKSGFGTRLVADNSLIENEGGVVQSITAGKATYIFTSKNVVTLSENRKSWIQLLDLETRWPDVPSKDDKKWTSVYLTKGIYFCHPVYGFHKMVKTPDDWYLDPRDQTDIPGLPFEPQAIAETNGRMIVLGSKYVAWSGPSNAEDFVPSLGGAGFELLSDRISGNPVTVVGFQNGFIVWTTQGCLTAEFIGGDTVFRFDRMTTEQLPVNSFAVEAMPDGSQLICTKQGIFRIQNAQEPEQIVPLFSEFVRQILAHESGLIQYDNRVHVRLNYEMEQDLLFLQFRDWTNHYVHTFVCSMALDKWGSFNERHLGIIKLLPERGNYGYVDHEGRPHRFLAAYNREKTPHHFVGLDSRITIGYIKPPELHGEIDSLLEMHEINIGGHPAIPSWYEVDEIDLGKLPDFLLTSEIRLSRKDGTFGLVNTCETIAQTPTLILAPSQSENQMSDNWHATNDDPGDSTWWDDVSFPIPNLDTGEIIQLVNDSRDYSDPSYITDRTHLNVLSSIGDPTVDYYPGGYTDTNLDAETPSTHYYAHDDVSVVDRYNGDFWAVMDWYNTGGSTLVRFVKDNDYQFQDPMFPVLHDAFENGGVATPETDIGLGQTNWIAGFTSNAIILLHEIFANNDFKLEALNKDTLTRISQHYIDPGTGNINGAIESGSFGAPGTMCIGPDERLYHANWLSPASSPDTRVFANGTRAFLYRFDPTDGSYTDITPWSDSDLPVDVSNVSSFGNPPLTSWGIKSIHYDRAIEKIVIFFGVEDRDEASALLTNSTGPIRFEWGEFDPSDDTWVKKGQMPASSWMDSNYQNCAQEDAVWFCMGWTALDWIKNLDGLPMASPCQEMLHTIEIIRPVVDGVPPTPTDANDPTQYSWHICIRDPAANYAVTQRFGVSNSRYDAIQADFDDGPFNMQFLRAVTRGTFSFDTEAFGGYYAPNFIRGYYLPNHKYFFYGAAAAQTVIWGGGREYSNIYNDDNSQFYYILEP